MKQPHQGLLQDHLSSVGRPGAEIQTRLTFCAVPLESLICQVPAAPAPPPGPPFVGGQVPPSAQAFCAVRLESLICQVPAPPGPPRPPFVGGQVPPSAQARRRDSNTVDFLCCAFRKPHMSGASRTRASSGPTFCGWAGATQCPGFLCCPFRKPHMSGATASSPTRASSRPTSSRWAGASFCPGPAEIQTWLTFCAV